MKYAIIGLLAIMAIIMLISLSGCAEGSDSTTPPPPIKPMTLVGQEDGISVYRIFDHANDGTYSLKALCYLAISDKGMDLECP